jgi:hypothetical protein
VTEPASVAGVLGLGFALGLRHALDVDHLAAVSALVSRHRSVWRASVAGALWGLGHTASLLAVAVVVSVARTRIPAWLGTAFELGVAVMLVALGASLLRGLAGGGTLHAHRHRHGDREHLHLHVHAADPPGRPHHHPVRADRRPFWVGAVHGLAGSAAVMLAVAAAIPSRALALAYVAVFGGGALGGMVAMSTLLGLPLVAVPRAERVLRGGVAAASIAVGALLAWQVGTGGS